MITGKAIDVLKTFSRQELKDMSLFLASPYFNTNKALIKLYEALKKNFSKLDRLTEEGVYNEVFPGKSYNYGIFKNLLSELYILQCRYFAVARLEFRQGEKPFLLKELMQRGLSKHADKVIKDTRGFFTDGKRLAIEDYHTDFTIEEYSAYTNYFRNKRWLENLYKLDDPLLMSKKFIIYFLMRLLSHYLFFTTKGLNLGNVDLKPVKKVIEDLFKYLKAHIDYDIPNIEVLYYIMKLRERPNDVKRFYTLKDTLLKHKEGIAWQIMSNCFIYLAEFCETQIEQGNDKFIKEIFLINNLNAENRPVHLHFGKIGPDLYEDVVRAGLAAGETAFVEKFIEKYLPSLAEPVRDETYFYALALLSFYKSDYTAALENLAKIKDDSFFRGFKIRTLYLLIYYATGQWEGLYSTVNSYKAIVKNQPKLSADEKKRHLKLISNIYHLGKLKEASFVDRSGLDAKLMQQLKELKNEPSFFRPWLNNEARILFKRLKLK
jgi:hypothetical protein